MPLACTEDDLRELLDRHEFTRSFGYAIDELADGQCTIRVPYQEAFVRPGGIISGQVYMAAADVAMWLAIKTRLGLSDHSVTAEMKTSFLKGGRAEFRCTAKVLKLGRRLIYGVAECADDKSELLTHHTLTYIRAEE